ncbi:11387_t:CDS:1, partial [Racocetra fulgida]
STYFDAGCYQYNSNTNSRNVHMKLRIFYPTNALRYSYLRFNNSIKTGKTFIVSGFIRHITPDFTIIELTDFDFISTNANTIQNVQVSASSVASDNRSDIDLIAEDVESATSKPPKRSRIITSRSSKQSTSSSSVTNKSATPFLTSVTPAGINLKTVQIQKGKNKLSDLALNCLETTVEDNIRDERVYPENVSEDDDLEYLREQDVEEEPKKKR